MDIIIYTVYQCFFSLLIIFDICFIIMYLLWHKSMIIVIVIKISNKNHHFCFTYIFY